MEKSTKSYFGMTQTQLSILGGLGFFAILVVCLFGYLVISSAPIPASSVPLLLPTQLPASPTLPLAQTPSPFPEMTGTPEMTVSPTPAISDVPPLDWIKFGSAGVELWLPGSFVGGDMVAKRKETIQKVNRLGSHFVDIVASMRKEAPTTLIFTVDKKIVGTVVTEVKVERIVLTEDVPLKNYIDQSYVSQGDLMIVLSENKKMSLLGLEARRLTYQSRQTSGLEGTVIEYAIKDGLNIWFVAYLLPPDEILNFEPVIKQSIATFKIIK